LDVLRPASFGSVDGRPARPPLAGAGQASVLAVRAPSAPPSAGVCNAGFGPAADRQPDRMRTSPARSAPAGQGAARPVDDSRAAASRPPGSPRSASSPTSPREAVRLLDQQAHHAWCAAAYLAGAVT